MFELFGFRCALVVKLNATQAAASLPRWCAILHLERRAADYAAHDPTRVCILAPTLKTTVNCSSWIILVISSIGCFVLLLCNKFHIDALIRYQGLMCVEKYAGVKTIGTAFAPLGITHVDGEFGATMHYC